MAVLAQCPNCGADIAFTTGAPMRVCDYCRGLIVRRDRDLENVGKVVDLVQSQSPLELGLDGVYGGRRFTLVGRAQIGHDKGGMWEEWYAAFADGRWGWLAEAQGRFFMTFEVEGEPDAPAFDALAPGQIVPGLPGGPWTVGEVAYGTRQGARGELPYRLVPGERFAFADLSGPEGQAATLDYGAAGAPVLYAGREVGLAELGWAKRAAAERAAPTVKADRLACPNCDGSLELRAPDRTMRVGCPFCGALLDVNEGKLTKLKLLVGTRPQPLLPLGKTGKIGGEALTVIGMLRRGVKSGGVWYEWDEYLLYAAKVGFRWLVQSNGHWSFVQPLQPSEVNAGDTYSSARGRRLKVFQAGVVEVKWVVGECYWRVTPGETVQSRDYVDAPFMLSEERDQSEVNWSLATYTPVAEVERAFEVELPAPSGIAPNQPYPHGRVFRTWGLLLTTTFLLALAIYSTRGTRTLLDQNLVFDPLDDAAGSRVMFTEPITLRARRNVEVTIDTPLSNNWFYVEGDFVDEDTGVVQSWSKTIEYYFGVEGGESWSEGGRRGKVYVSAAPTGLYTLRLEAQWGEWQRPMGIHLRVRDGVPRWGHWGLLVLGISLVPIGVLIHRISFEKTRWEDSDFAPGGDDE
jgi:hypothetical protein